MAEQQNHSHIPPAHGQVPLPQGNEWIISKPRVCGGDAIVCGTRIPVWLIAKWRWAACTEENLIETYPALSSEGIRAAMVYAEAHREEVERQIVENETA